MNSSIELLESRIAPAAIFVSANTATYTDQDGDLITVKFGKPILTDGVGGNVATILATSAAGSGERLDLINLTGVAGAAGTSISVTAKLAGNGDGLVNVGRISSDVDLGAVAIRGDLHEIDAGDLADTTKAGVKSLSVYSFGLATILLGGAAAESTIQGPLGSLTVKTDMPGPRLLVVAAVNADAKIGSVTIGGTLSGSGADFTGVIGAEGSIGKVKIGGDIFGNAGQDSGVVYSSFGNIGSITIGGSIYGGGINSGALSAGLRIGKIKIGGDVTGGSGHDSGQIFSGTGTGSITLGGSLIGGAGFNSANLISTGSLGPVKIGGSVRGEGDAINGNTAAIAAYGGSIAGITIGRDAIAGDGTANGSIFAQTSLGPVKIGGSIYSAGTGDFLIRAIGTPENPVAIAALTVAGSVRDAVILAGYNVLNAPVSGNASIGAVKVGGNWIASSIAAGVENTVFPNFGDANDSLIGTPALVSKIASITIGGFVSGTVGGSDHFGFVAQEIGKLSIGGTKIAIPAPGFGARDLGLTGDFTVVQIPLVT